MATVWTLEVYETKDGAVSNDQNLWMVLGGVT